MDLLDQLKEHLGRAFVVERELGGGGMSRVFVAEEVRLSRRVVVKVLSPELSEGLNAERFEREILLAASLQQANIVPVLAAGRLGNLPYFTMPFVEGESLRHKLGAGGMSISEVVSILRDVSKALSYAHARGIVHRDIKPDNVLLSGGTAVVTDFGIAKALSASRTAAPGGALTQVGTSIGTPAYMAPEQVAGDPNIDQRVDLYSLGAMAFELLTGRPPFADLTPQKMLAAHLSEAPASVRTLRADCPPALTDMVAALLEKDPERRIQSARDVTAALDQTSTSSQPTRALEGPGSLVRAIGMWGVATGASWILAKAATVGIGLPEWVVPGALIVMGLGLPALLLTAWVRRTAFNAAIATPTITPGGSIAPPSGTMATMALKASPHVSWRRTARGGAFAMGGFVLVVAVFMAMRTFGIGSAGSLFAKGMMTADDRIVLASLAAVDDDTAFASVVGVAIREAMSQSKSIRLLDRAEVAGVLGEMQRDRGATVTGEIADEVARRSGAKAILGGRLARVGSNGYAITLELRSAADGTVLAAYPGTADGPSEVLETVDKLARKLRSKVGESLKAVASTIPLERATTGSFEALEKYDEAAQFNDVTGEFDLSVAAAREAIALDSTFALAWRKLAVALGNGSGSIVARDSALDMAFRLADRLPDRERYAAIGAYYNAHSAARDVGRAIDAYGALYRVDSTDRIALVNLAMAYADRGQADSAEYFARLDLPFDSDNTFGPGFLFQVLIRGGRYAEARALNDSVIAAGDMDPTSWGARFARLIQGWAEDRFDEVDTTYRAIMTGTPVGMRLNVAAMMPAEHFTRGRVGEGVQGFDSLGLVLASRGNGLHLPMMDSAAAAVFLLGDARAAVRLIDATIASAAWREAPPVLRPYLRVVTWYGLAGAPAKARQMMAEFTSTSPRAAAPEDQPAISMALGVIAGAAGDQAASLNHYRAAMVGPGGVRSEVAPTVTFLLAQYFDIVGMTDSARVWLEKYREFPRWTRQQSEPYALATVERRLGEIYDANGENAKAIEMYGKFVNRWRDADAVLQPTVSSVRARLTELQQQEAP